MHSTVSATQLASVDQPHVTRTSPAESNHIQQQPQHNQQSNLHHMHLQELALRLHQTQGQSSLITQQDSQQQHSDNIQSHNSPVNRNNNKKHFTINPIIKGCELNRFV